MCYSNEDGRVVKNVACSRGNKGIVLNYVLKKCVLCSCIWSCLYWYFDTVWCCSVFQDATVSGANCTLDPNICKPGMPLMAGDGMYIVSGSCDFRKLTQFPKSHMLSAPWY